MREQTHSVRRKMEQVPKVKKKRLNNVNIKKRKNKDARQHYVLHTRSLMSFFLCLNANNFAKEKGCPKTEPS